MLLGNIKNMLAFFGRYDYEMDIKLHHLVLKKVLQLI